MQTREQFLSTGLVPVLSKQNAEDDECPICFNDGFTDPVKTPCGHVFDRACLTTWLSGDKRNTCPLCKQVLFQLSEAETLGPAEARRRRVAQALQISNLISREAPFYNYGSTEYNISSLQRATAQATHTLAHRQRVPGAGQHVELGPPGIVAQVSGPCAIDLATLSPGFIAMANLLPAFREALEGTFTPAEMAAWRSVCETLWGEIQALKGKRADAMILAHALKQKTLTSLINARNAEISAAERSFIAQDGRNVEVFDTLLDYLVLRAWVQEREAEGRKAKKKQTERLRREAREESKVETKCAIM